ncbi:MAG: hypothetical protein AMJ53_06680 [Gammaproteobacteria bacterium SG8_11]|nr:MAG: hypothetical protein AMJ53_06680 [Gammaproteobacteria bacterium SG8_11]
MFWNINLLNVIIPVLAEIAARRAESQYWAYRGCSMASVSQYRKLGQRGQRRSMIFQLFIDVGLKMRLRKIV